MLFNYLARYFTRKATFLEMLFSSELRLNMVYKVIAEMFIVKVNLQLLIFKAGAPPEASATALTKVINTCVVLTGTKLEGHFLRLC